MTARRVAATVTAAVFSVVTGLVGATTALAQVPLPDTGTSGGTGHLPAAPVTSTPGTSHTLLYVVIAVAAVAAVAMLAAGARFYGHRTWRATPKVA